MGFTKKPVFAVLLLLFVSGLRANAKTVSEIAIKGDVVEFSAKSNVSAIEVKGASKSSTGSVKLIESSNGFVLESLKIAIPVKSLETGIAVRDTHMRDKIFKVDDGSYPDITFESSKSPCEKSDSGYTCKAKGMMSMHGKSHETTIPVAVTRQSGEFVAKADFAVALTDFGIEPPSHFGVGINNNVSIKTVYHGTVTSTRASEEKPVANIAAAEPPAKADEPVAAQAAERAPAGVDAASLASVGQADGSQIVSQIVVRLKNGTELRGLSFKQLLQIIKMPL